MSGDESPTPRPSRAFEVHAEAVREIVAFLRPRSEAGELDAEGKELAHEAANLMAFYDGYLSTKTEPPEEDRRRSNARVFRLHVNVVSYRSKRGW